jgi:hypothetical protein
MKSTIIRQPGYLPYIGFFKKIQSCDIFVHYDDSQYSINGEDNRNKIRTKQKSIWLTVPVKKAYKKKINEIEISNNTNWAEKHKNLLKENYQKSPFFNDYWDSIDSILSKKWEKLIDLNLEFIEFFCSVLELKTEKVLSSKFNLNSTRSQKLLDICKNLNVTTYISGELGKKYLEEEIFSNAKIKILYEKFQHPIYNQFQGDFVKNMSIIDLVFNEGKNSKNILKESINL